MAKFQKGESGNPRGRPPGVVSQMKLRASIEKDLPEILAAMVTAAKGGDTTAARLLLDRVLPALKPADQPVTLPLAGTDLGGDGREIIAAVGASIVTPEQGGRLLAGLGSLSRVIETDELLKRVVALEAASHGKPTE
ncbi:DUF5681 domain-containing protein [Thiocapsa bogorovii]|uniref:DUF5681 domain-containing protein n=1 Tax=Thiocapsa bogorovii TaxID=521689 RepID=UPI001E3B8306|nr:DUF5681 domain-containing protein [Thiocapsa bogorovii]UHD17391.1 DUF5681 domain-containing protein [Thiocapsa bogorovii]